MILTAPGHHHNSGSLHVSCTPALPPQHCCTLQAHCQAKQLGTLEAASQNVNTLCSHGAGLLVTLFLALTALQFVISSNLPNSRCGAHLGPSVTRLVLGFRHALCRLSSRCRVISREGH